MDARSTLAGILLPPLRQQRSRLATIILALAILGAASGLILFSLNSFIKALFATPGADVLIPVAELLPKAAARYFPELVAMSVPRSVLAYVVPVILVAAGLCNAGADYLYQLNQQALALYVARHYREKLFGALMALPYVEIRRRSPGAWMSSVMNDVMFLQGRFSELVTGLVRDSVVVLACFIVLLTLQWQAALVLLAIAPLIAYGMGRTGKRISHFAEAVQREMARIASSILDMRSRFDFIRAQGGEACERARFGAINDAYYAMISRSIMVRSVFSPSLEFVGFALFAAFVYAVGNGLWGQGFSPELLLQFFAALGLLVKPLKGMGEQISRFAETKGALNKSLELFETMAAMKDKPAALRRAAKTPERFDGLTLRRVEAGFDGKVRFAARDLVLVPGRAVVIIGPSGAGKSTLLKSLAGLIEPVVWEANLAWAEATRCCSMVSQEPFLFDDTLRENLVYGLAPAQRPSAAEIWAALAEVNIEAEIRALESGLETRVRAIASNFSGGQVQRLVIARALLRRQPLVALDEATSAIDARSERDITLRLIERCHAQGQALIAVTHRLQWLDAFDEVWFVEDGQVKLKGAHRELMARARYREYCASAGLKAEYEGRRGGGR